MVRRRRSTWLMILSVLSLMLSVLPSYADFGVEQKVPIILWYALKAPYGDQFATLVKGFEAKNTHVTIIIKNFVDPELLREALKTSAQLPDVALVDAAWQDELVNSGKLVAMEDLMDKTSNMCRIVFKADVFPPLYRLGLKDGKLWTAPTFAMDTALIYNKDMFAAKKITKPPATWALLVDDARKLTDASNGVWGFELPVGSLSEELGRFFSILAWQMGGDVATMNDPVDPEAAKMLDIKPADGTVKPPVKTKTAAKDAKGKTADAKSKTADAKGKTADLKDAKDAKGKTADAKTSEVKTKDDEVEAAPPVTVFQALVGLLVDMVQKYRVAPIVPTDDMSKVAMFVGTPESFLAAESKGIPVMAAPLPCGKIKVTDINVYSFAVFSTSPDPMAAFQFATWAGEFEQSLQWSMSTPYLPANKQVTLSPDYFQYLTKHPGLRIYLSQMVLGRLEPVTHNYRQLLTQIGDSVKDAILRNVPMADVMKGMLDESRRLLQLPHSEVTPQPLAH